MHTIYDLCILSLAGRTEQFEEFITFFSEDFGGFLLCIRERFRGETFAQTLGVWVSTPRVDVDLPVSPC